MKEYIAEINRKNEEFARKFEGWSKRESALHYLALLRPDHTDEEYAEALRRGNPEWFDDYTVHTEGTRTIPPRTRHYKFHEKAFEYLDSPQARSNTQL